MPRLTRRALLGASIALLGCETRDTSGGPPRVVSLSPSTTEALFAIGAGSLQVGRSAQCDYPPEVSAIPSVGGFADPNIERVIALRPTLVVGSRGPAGPIVEERLRAHGITTFFPATGSIHEILAMLTALGRHIGPEALDRARLLESSIVRRLATIERGLVGRDEVRCVMLFDVSPIYVAGPGGFPDELLQRAGGRNLVTAGGAYPTIDLEHLLRLDPDVIVDAMSMGRPSSQLAEVPGFDTIAAVRRGAVRALDSAAALRPGPRIAEGVAAVARALRG